jgi:hypothetical protein
MPKRKEPEPPPRPHLIVPEEDARRKIEKQIERGIQLKDRSITSREELRQATQDKDAWRAYNEQLLLTSFNHRAILDMYYQRGQFRTIRMSRYDFAGSFPIEVRDLRGEVEDNLGLLRSLLSSLELFNEVEKESERGRKDSARDFERSVLAHPPKRSESKTFIHIGDIYNGDVFRNISGSTLVNHSLVEKSFTKVREHYDDEAALAIVRVAEVVANSGNAEAGELFDAFNEELQKPEPKRSVLRNCWDGLVKAIPSLVQAGDLAVNIAKLFLSPPS